MKGDGRLLGLISSNQCLATIAETDSSEEASQLMDFVTDLTVKDKRLLVQMSSGVENNVLQTKRINFNVAISHFASGKFEL